MLAGLVLFLLVASAAAAPSWGRPGAGFLAAVSVVWLLVSQSMEGTVLLVLSPTHGLTSADLGGVAGLLVAAWVWLRPRQASKHDS
jgi:hypothetical protein